MKCYVISLPQAGERRERVTEEFRRADLPFEFFDAVDGTRLSETTLASVDREARRRRGLSRLDDAALACALSHMAVFRALVVSGDKMAAIFEDDCLLGPAIGEILSALEHGPRDFGAVMLHQSRRGLPERKLARRFRSVRQVTTGHEMGRFRFHDQGAFGYVITRAGAQHMLREFPRPVHGIDWIMPRYWENGMFNVHYLKPPVVFHNYSLPSYIESARQGSWDENRRNIRASPALAIRRFGAKQANNFGRWLAWRKMRRFDTQLVTWGRAEKTGIG